MLRMLLRFPKGIFDGAHQRVQPGHLGISVAVQPSGSDDPGREWRFTYDYQQAQPVSVRLEA